MEWSNLYRGLIMGITDLIPGVSGGTIAVILGIYDRLLEAISGIFSTQWRRHFGFLLPLGIGMVTGLFALSRAIDYLLENHFVPTQFFFLGLIVGVLPLLVRQADAKRQFRLSHWIVLLISAALIASMAFLAPEPSAEPIVQLEVLTVIGLFLAGWLGSLAMLLPGISGSFVLLLVGVYPTAIYALSNFHIPLIVTIGSGVMVGFVVSSRAIRYVLARYPVVTHAALIGLIIGSIAVIFPGFPQSSLILVSILTFVLGAGLALFVGKRGV